MAWLETRSAPGASPQARAETEGDAWSVRLGSHMGRGCTWDSPPLHSAPAPPRPAGHQGPMRLCSPRAPEPPAPVHPDTRRASSPALLPQPPVLAPGAPADRGTPLPARSRPPLLGARRDHTAHNAPRRLASGRLGVGAHLVPPPPHVTADSSCTVSDTRPTVAPEVPAGRAQQPRAHAPRPGTRGSVPTPAHRVAAPDHAPLAAQRRLLPVRPNARPHPPEPPPELLAHPWRLPPQRLALVILITARGCAGGLRERTWTETRPPAPRKL